MRARCFGGSVPVSQSITRAERVEVSAGRAVAGARKGGSGLRANDGMWAGASDTASFLFGVDRGASCRVGPACSARGVAVGAAAVVALCPSEGGAGVSAGGLDGVGGDVGDDAGRMGGGGITGVVGRGLIDGFAGIPVSARGRGNDASAGLCADAATRGGDGVPGACGVIEAGTGSAGFVTGETTADSTGRAGGFGTSVTAGRGAAGARCALESTGEGGRAGGDAVDDSSDVGIAGGAGIACGGAARGGIVRESIGDGGRAGGGGTTDVGMAGFATRGCGVDGGMDVDAGFAVAARSSIRGDESIAGCAGSARSFVTGRGADSSTP